MYANVGFLLSPTVTFIRVNTPDLLFLSFPLCPPPFLPPSLLPFLLSSLEIIKISDSWWSLTL
jgi:hypothetical protein